MGKLPRVHQKIFAENALDNEIGQFGSAIAGEKNETGDIAEIQALDAWEQGWSEANVSKNRYPTMQERNGIDKVVTQQLAYIFQEGIPEWNAETEYSDTSLVKVDNNLYKSKVANNIGHLVTETDFWEKFYEGATKDLDNLTEAGEKHFLNKSQITNCLLEVPQKIKLELVDGVLTLKAGSEVIIPNGFEEDGTTPKFDYVTLQQDLSVKETYSYTGNILVIVNADATALLTERIGIVSSGTTPGNHDTFGTWYNTTENIIKRTTDNGVTWNGNFALPIAFGSYNNLITSIDQIFNGMGYIGSTVWVDKGVKGLIPNGRNEDGSLKNIEFTINKIVPNTLTYGAQNYYLSLNEYDTPLFTAKDVTKYDSDRNVIIDTYANLDRPWCFAGECIADVNNKITSFSIKQPFRTIDYNDFTKAVNNSLNKQQITNCILEIPQNIRYTINDAGKLILNAGSKVYVSTNGTFEPVTLTTNTAADAGGLWTTDHSRMLLVVYIPDTNTVATVAWNYVYHQTSAPTTFLAGSAFWHDTSNNTLKLTYDSGANWRICSLPILCGKPGETNIGWRGYVDSVFNSWGFFGSYTFSLPGIRALFADGRNNDGTLRNIEYTLDSVAFHNLATNTSWLGLYNLNGEVSNYGVFNYFEQDTNPSADIATGTSSALWYDTKNNYVYSTHDKGATWTKTHLILIGALRKSSTANIIKISEGKAYCSQDVNHPPTKWANQKFLSLFAPDFTRSFSIANNTVLQAPEALWARATGTNSQFHAWIGTSADNLTLWQQHEDTSNGSGNACVSIFVPKGYYYKVMTVGTTTATAYLCKTEPYWG